jgi:hypothetical protein
MLRVLVRLAVYFRSAEPTIREDADGNSRPRSDSALGRDLM